MKRLAVLVLLAAFTSCTPITCGGAGGTDNWPGSETCPGGQSR